MAEKKKQHYVPRFYLKIFSDEERKSISIFNLKSERHIKGGNLKNQCYEPYFYGKDLEIENAFSVIEDSSSNSIHKIIAEKETPKQFSEEHILLLTFVLFQYARTKYSEEEGNELIDKLIKTVLSKNPEFNQEEINKLVFKNSVSNQIKTMARSIPIAADLKCKLLINKTKFGFITSDNPVVLYNSACEKFNFGSATGLSSRGLMIFFPISPKDLLLFYDAKVYKTGNRRQNYSLITESSDVEQINDLQWRSALMNIYHNNSVHGTEIQRGFRKNIKHRDGKKANVIECPAENGGDGPEKTLIHMYKSDIKIGLNLNCIKQIKDITEEDAADGEKRVRDFMLVQAHRKFIKLVESGKYKMHQFGEYIAGER